MLASSIILNVSNNIDTANCYNRLTMLFWRVTGLTLSWLHSKRMGKYGYVVKMICIVE